MSDIKEPHQSGSGRLGSAKQNPTIDNQGYDRSMQYRRAKSPGSSYFFTLVTHNRRPILCEPENFDSVVGREEIFS